MNSKLYHLSSSERPTANEDGLFLVAPACYLFKHWQVGQIYLHWVEVEEGECVEDGHYDGVSSFQFDQHLLCTKVELKQSWNLSDLNSIANLLLTDFLTQGEQGLVTSFNRFYTALVCAVSSEDIAKLNQQVPLFNQLKHGRFDKETELAFEKYLNAVSLTENQLDELSISESRWQRDLEKGQATKVRTSIVTRYVSANYGSFSQVKLPELRQKIFELLLINELPLPEFNHCRILVSSHLLISLVRNRRTKQLLKLNDASLYLDPLDDYRHTIDRAVVFGERSLVDWLLAKLERECTPEEYKEYRYRLASSQSAACDEQQPISQQLKRYQNRYRNRDVEYLAENGYLYALNDKLKRGEYKQRELETALTKAAERGYLSIVVTLHDKGASLDAGGYWPIKFANRFGYSDLKSYLLAHGQPDKHFY